MKTRPFALLKFVFPLLLCSSRLFAQGDDTPTGMAGSFGGSIQTGAGSYDPYERNASRSVTDLVVPGAVVPLHLTRIWNSRASSGTLNYGEIVGWSNNLTGWSMDSIESDEDLPPGSNPNDLFQGYQMQYPDGRSVKFNKPTSPAHAPPGCPGTYTPNALSPGVLEKLVIDSTGHAQFLLPDGGVINFTTNGGDGVLNSIVDPYGRALTVTFDVYGNATITEPAGRWIKLSAPPNTYFYSAATITATSSLGQMVTYTSNHFVSGSRSWSEPGPSGTPNPAPTPYDGNAAADGAGIYTSTSTVTYNNVADPATGQPIQAQYVSKNVQPPGIGVPNNPPPPAFDRLIWAYDPMFEGPLQQVKYIYIDNPYYAEGDWNMNGVCEERWAANSTDAGISTMKMDLPSWTTVQGQLPAPYWTRIQTRGDGATRTLSWFNPTTKYTYYYNNQKYQATGEGQNLIDHFTDFTNNLNVIETDQYDTTHNFQTPIKITDTLGHVTNQTLESTLGKITQEAHPDLSHQDWTYTSTTAPYYVATKKDENGNQTTFTRDPTSHLVTRIDYAGGTFETFAYNSFGQCTDHQLASGAHETANYDATGLKKNSTDSVTGETTKYTYDTLNRLQTVKDPRAIALGLPYSEKYEYNGRNQITVIHYAAVPGGSADPQVTYTYDGRGRCTAIADELGNTRMMAYDDYSRITSYTEPLNAVGWNGTGTVASRTWNWTYERVRNGTTYPANTHLSRNWRTETEPVFDANGDKRMTVHEYDVNDRLVTEQTGWVVNSGGTATFGSDGETHSFTYDTEGNKQTYTDPLNRLTSYAYDTRNRLTTTTEPLNRITTTTLDAVSNKTKVTFPDNTTQQWGGYDAFGQPATFTDERADITNLAYQWGPMKKLATVTTHRDKDAGGTENQLTTFIYDGLGRATKTTFPDLSTEVTSYQYGEVSTWKTRKGATKTLSYDNRGRESSHSWSDGVTPSVTTGWDDANRISSLANVFSTIGYSYDSAGQVITESNNVAGSSGNANLSYARYPDGAPSLVTYPNGFGLRRDYTARGQLDKTGSADASGNYLTQFVDYNYFADGKVNSETYGNGVQTTYGYDGRGFVNNTKTAVVSSGAIYSNRTYYRDTRDRITAWVKSNSSASNPLENARGDAYTYDAEGQLTAASYEAKTPNGTPKTPQRTESFIYDAMGNRKGVNQLAARGSVTFSRKDTGLNEYSAWTPSSISYDTNGSLTAEGWIGATYDALNQPVYITSPSTAIPPGDSVYFGYDPLGRPVKRWYAPTGAGTAADNPATYLYYEGWDLVAEGSDSIAISRIYAHGDRIDEIVTDSKDGGTTWAYHQYDARTHAILLTDGSGNLLEQYDYDAFGKAYYYDGNGNSLTTSAWGNRFLFTGREWLSDLSVYDFRARLYHAELGRFVQPDPKEFGAGDYNIYRYCHNDPVNKSDPTGLNPIVPGMGKGQVYWGVDAETDYDLGKMQSDSSASTQSGGSGSTLGLADGPDPNQVTAVDRATKDGRLNGELIAPTPHLGSSNFEDFKYQTRNPYGEPFAVRGMQLAEEKTTDAPKKATINTSGPLPTTSKGIATDTVGVSGKNLDVHQWIRFKLDGHYLPTRLTLHSKTNSAGRLILNEVKFTNTYLPR